MALKGIQTINFQDILQILRYELGMVPATTDWRISAGHARNRTTACMVIPFMYKKPIIDDAIERYKEQAMKW